jgi:putative NIF3 family GTP cyclohydrolase 1 type 2
VLADKRWDNVGLLLDSIDLEDEEPPITPGLDPEHKVLLTNDLTAVVGEEAIRLGVRVIVSYRK